ncbi:hypothetical protein WOLCODRAFT_135239 [Wolfiporia cocos MD-104 SS10]|uniref:DUF803-domain-containing protein n=1 Tax=Wolfiporia cocos (strain MD-104) TaxID=742152 RepID=A0A2H3IUJ0_WOLCO|nr:hypothetical protein WOLCODRAFT_135239 [Wolfiporia cocos MD-104 SS10]
MNVMAAHSLDGDTHISIPAGIAVGLLASFVQSLGLTIQRKSHVVNQALPEDEQRVEHRRPLWLLGFGIFISSNLFGSVFQIASLPVVILAPLGAVSLLWNAFFARILLGDVFSVWMLLGTLLIAGGAVLIAVFGIVPEPTHSLEDLLMLFNRPLFVVYFSLLGMVTVVCLVITHIAEYSYSRRIALPDVSPPLSPLLAPASHPSILTSATTASTAAPDPSERTPLLDRKPRAHVRSLSHPRSKSPSPSGTTSSQSYLSSAIEFTTKSTRTPLLLAASYASFSGIISGMCLLFAKSGVELLMLTIGGDNQFWRWQAWVLLLSLGVCALLQLWYMHKSLILADPTVVCPLAFCFYNLSSILNGLVYFDQFSLLSATQLALVLVGIAILLAGVWIVSFPPTGGYSIDVGAWMKDADDIDGSALSDSELGLYDDEDEEDEEDVPDDEPLPMYARLRTSPTPRAERISMGSVSSDMAAPPPHPHTRSPTLVVSPPPPVPPPVASPPADVATFPARRPRPRTQITLPASSAPSMRRARSSYASTGQGESPTLARRRRTTLGALALSPPPPTPGFSIGLSPVSPGFALVPTERRRREGEERGEERRRSVRRGSSVGYGARDTDAEEGAAAVSPREEERQERARRARGRWAWVRSVITGRPSR